MRGLSKRKKRQLRHQQSVSKPWSDHASTAPGPLLHQLTIFLNCQKMPMLRVMIPRTRRKKKRMTKKIRQREHQAPTNAPKAPSYQSHNSKS